MKNKIQQGDVMPYINETGAAIASGDPVLVGKVFGVAVTDIAIGKRGDLDLLGVFEIRKNNSDIEQGDQLYWDPDATPVGGASGAGALSTTSTDNTAVGKAWADAGPTATTVQIRLGL